MTQSAALIDTLKRALKENGLNYADVAKAVDLSEASIKRLFSVGGFTLERVDEICSLVHMELTDLIHMYETSRHKITHLLEDQEKELVADNKLLLVTICVRNGWNFENIIQHYEISESEAIRYLARLDRLGMIDLLPKNRIRMRIAQDFRWLPNGPIERHFQKQVQTEFFKSSFSKVDELRFFLTGMLRKSSYEILMRKLNEFSEEFSELLLEDTQYPLDNRENVGLVLAVRPWELSAFDALRRSS